MKTAHGLRLHPAPVDLLAAWACAPTADVGAVWTWDGRPCAPDDESAYRSLSRSFVRFLIERDGDDWPRRVGEWASLRPADDPALVRSWRRWLDETGFLGRVERGVLDDDPIVRERAANGLPNLAESATTLRDRLPGIERALGARSDAVALRFAASDDVVVAEPAARYLVYFRARDVSEAALHELSNGAAPPWSRLVALAVAARRGGVAEPTEAASLWSALSVEDRRRFQWLPTFLPLTR